MSLAFAQTPPTLPRPFTTNRTNPPLFSNFPPTPQPLLFLNTHSTSLSLQQWRVHVLSSQGEPIDANPQRKVDADLSLDDVLSFTEVLFVVPPALYAIGHVVGLFVPTTIKPFQVNLGSKVFALQFFLLVGAVVVGGLIRRRQWGRICRESRRGDGADLLARIEKVEEDLRSSATIVRVLSRQLEKLGIRFRITRKALREPIAEAAALAQKNSEATRALAMQEDNLENELGEIQKVLLAMQEQQQKQLELVLAIAKAGKFLEGKPHANVSEQATMGTSKPIPEEMRVSNKGKVRTSKPVLEEERTSNQGNVGTSKPTVQKKSASNPKPETGRHTGVNNDRA